MDDNTGRIPVCYYIGRTKYMAGIFLTRKIAEGKKYGNSLALTQYQSYEEAEKAFFDSYGDWVTREGFQANRLYDVKRRDIYAVVLIPEGAGVFERENLANTFLYVVGRRFNPFADQILEGLDYEAAVKKVKVIMSKKVGKIRIERFGNPPINHLITWEEAAKRRSMTGFGGEKNG